VASDPAGEEGGAVAAAKSDPTVEAGGSEPAGEESDGASALGAEDKVSVRRRPGISYLMRGRRPSWLRRENRRIRLLGGVRWSLGGRPSKGSATRRWCSYRSMVAAAPKLGN
jgi:hypothetical protein